MDTPSPDKHPYAIVSRLPSSGYDISDSSPDLSEDERQGILDNALPSGSGAWVHYKKAHGLKVFHTKDKSKIAVSHFQITEEHDPSGREGLLYTKVELIPQTDYVPYLSAIYADLLTKANLMDDNLPDLSMPVYQRLLYRLRFGQQLIFSFPYETPQQWDYAAAAIVKLVLQKLGNITPFSTLSLYPDKEAALVLMPLQEAQKHNIPSIPIPLPAKR
jgi:hypothetical protein